MTIEQRDQLVRLTDIMLEAIDIYNDASMLPLLRCDRSWQAYRDAEANLVRAIMALNEYSQRIAA